MAALINPSLERATHSTSTRYLGGNLSAYLVITMILGGQRMDRPASIPNKSGNNSPTPMEWKAKLAWAGNPKQEPGIDCTQQPAPRPTALHTSYQGTS